MKAVFLDRDGVVNELVYYAEHGIVDSPFTAAQFRLCPGVPEAISALHTLGYQVVVASNQPGMAKGYFSEGVFAEVRQEMAAQLARAGAYVDGEYYCFHHPEARVERLKAACGCRKPKPGLLLQAARDLGIDLSSSWMVGDGLTDIQAGQAAGCRSILIGKAKCELCARMHEENVHPTYICSDLRQAAGVIKAARGGG